MIFWYQANSSNSTNSLLKTGAMLEAYSYSWYHIITDDMRFVFFPMVLLICIAIGFTFALINLLMIRVVVIIIGDFAGARFWAIFEPFLGLFQTFISDFR